MSYSRGVLIHNFNEDRFGVDLLNLSKPAPTPRASVSHTVHHWKEPDPNPQLEPQASLCLDKHVFFGHSGDMRCPRTNLQKTEFATASRYFMQDPKQVSGVGALSADLFTSDDPKSLPHTSHL